MAKTYAWANSEQTVVKYIDTDFGEVTFIPIDISSRFYDDYLKWVADGNTPEPAPEPPAPGPDYLAFWDSLMVSTVYASIREQSFTSLPMNTLATEFIALIGDAKAGRANENAIQASIDAILSTGTFTSDDLTELQSALVAGHLDQIYVLPQP
jgi:hypothetical protein